jgi:hypothetical protein
MVSEDAEVPIKKATFRRMTFASSKKYFCSKVELILTSKNFTIVCKNHWALSLPLHKFRFESLGENLEVYDNYYGRLRFRLAINGPEEWAKAIQAIKYEEVRRIFYLKPDLEGELKRLLTLNPDALKDLLRHVRKEMDEYQRRNIQFNLEIQDKTEKVQDRKLKAFMIAHIYVAWYEWVKNLLYKIHKAKMGKGPKDDNELLKFLENYPSLKHYMDTSDWGMNPNQIRNCIAHERFFFDYKTGELLFMAGKEKRVRLFDLRGQIRPMIHFYFSFLDYLRKCGNVIAES